MSAFVVEDKTINTVVSFLNSTTDPFSAYPFKTLGYDSRSIDDLERLARDLYLMNCDAVDARYGKGKFTTSDAELAFTFSFVNNPNPVAVYKHAKCLRYQCSEGDVPERHLFKALEQFIETIATQIIEEIPGYKETAWG